jgi:hypothetical protein
MISKFVYWSTPHAQNVSENWRCPGETAFKSFHFKLFFLKLILMLLQRQHWGLKRGNAPPALAGLRRSTSISYTLQFRQWGSTPI